MKKSKNIGKRLTGVLMIVGMLLQSVPFTVKAAEGEIKRIYVSPYASGGNGTKASPLGSVEQALKIASSYAKGMSSGRVEVILADGTYRLSKTLNLGNDINGTDNVELAIIGEEGALPKITTAKELPNDKFTKITDKEILAKLPPEGKNGAYQINLKELGISKYGHNNEGSSYRTFDLFMDSELMIPAKWPNDDRTKSADINGKSRAGELIYSDTAKKIYTFTTEVDKDRLERWENAQEATVFGNLSNGWTSSWYTLVGTEPEKQAITIQGALSNGVITKGYPWFVENLIEELDAPGEYYLDRKTGMLYVYPFGDIKKALIEYSVTTNDSITEDAPQNIIKINDGKNIVFENIEISNSVGYGVILTSGNVKIRNCRMKNLYRGFSSWSCNNSEISGSEISYTKSQGLLISGGNRNTLTPSNSLIHNNYIHNCQLGSRLGAAMTIHGVGVTVSNNLIADVPHWAIQYGGNDHTIKNNEIYAALLESADAGVFYTGRDMTTYGNVLEKNYIHDIRRFDGGLGIMVFYQDDQGSGITVRNNIMQRVTGAILNGGGRDNTMTGNVIIDGFENSYMAPLCDARGYGTLGEAMRTDFWNSAHGKSIAAVPYDSEIWLAKYPQVKATVDDPERHRPFNTTVTNNIISNYMREKAGDIAGQVREFGTVENNHYIPQALSYEYNENGIITFTDKSEFTDLGCEWIDTSDIGVLGTGNYTIPQKRSLFEEYVVDLANQNVERELVKYPEKVVEIVDLLSDPQKLDGTGTVTKSGGNVIFEPGATLGFNAEKYGDFVLRGKFKTSPGFTQMPIYFKAIDTTKNCWSGNNSYSVWLKSDYMELQKWNPGSTVFGTYPSTIKTDGSWNTIEIVSNTLSNGGIDLYLNINGKTIFDVTDFDSNKIEQPGYFTIKVAGAPVEFGKYEKTINSTNELYTDKNNASFSNEAEKKKEEGTEEKPEIKTVKVYIDEKPFKLETDAYIKNGRTYVPLRAIFEKMGARVLWYENTRSATAFYDNNRMCIGIGDPFVVLNGEQIPTDSPAEIVNDNTMIGVRFVAEMFGCEVEWNGEDRIVSILTPDFQSEEELEKEKDEKKPQNSDDKMSVKYEDKDNVLLLHRRHPKVYFDSNEPIKEGEADGKDFGKRVDYDSEKEDYYIRTKLLNFIQKITNQPDRKLNIVFLGGSITQNDGYRNLICDWFTKQYGDRFNFVNSGWGGTDSAMGADRLYFDVGTYDPDLVFVEFAVDDRGQTDENIARNMESIVRQIYDLNDTTEIVFVYTVHQEDMEMAASGKWTQTARIHDAVAEHYGIPSVFMGRELAQSVKSGKAVWNKDDVDDEYKDLPVYMEDKMYPLEAGTEKYFETAEKFLKDLLINNTIGLETKEYFSSPYLFRESAGSRQYFAIDDYIEGSNMNKEPASKYLNAHRTIENVYTSETVGDGVTFTFTGTRAGVYILAGVDAGGIDIYVDGEYVGTETGFRQTFTADTMMPIMIETPVLENGKHIVSFKISETLPDKSMVNGLDEQIISSKKSTFESGYVTGILQ